MTPRFHPLRIAEVRRETPECVSLKFDVPAGLADEYRFTQGQHLALRATLDGEELRRSYSVCSGCDDGELRVAVKKVPGGRFSVWANEALRPGDAIDVMTPEGRFFTPLDPAHEKHYVAFVAGSGITPVLSLIRTTLAREPRSRFTLVYGNRASGTVMFREELAALKDRYLARFNLVHVLSREAHDLPLLHGHIDRAKADALLAHWVPLPAIDTAFVCGPEGMMDAVVAALQARGFPEARIKVERFAASIPKHAHVAHRPPEPGHAECEVTEVAPARIDFRVPVVGQFQRCVGAFGRGHEDEGEAALFVVVAPLLDKAEFVDEEVEGLIQV